MFGPCKVCAEKERRVSTLESEVTFLRTLVFKPVNNERTPFSNFEANGLMDGNDQEILMESRETSRERLTDEELAERESILGASY